MRRAVVASIDTDAVAADAATRMSTPEGIATLVASSPFSVLENALDCLGAYPRTPRGLKNSFASEILASHFFSRSQNSVIAWESGSATEGNLQVANVLSTLGVDLVMPGSGRHGSLPVSCVLYSGSDVSRIWDSVLRQHEARLHGVQVRMPLEQGTRTVPLANAEVTTVTHNTVALQPTVRTPWCLRALNPECHAMSPDCDTVCIVGCVTVHLWNWRITLTHNGGAQDHVQLNDDQTARLKVATDEDRRSCAGFDVQVIWVGERRGVYKGLTRPRGM